MSPEDCDETGRGVTSCLRQNWTLKRTGSLEKVNRLCLWASADWSRAECGPPGRQSRGHMRLHGLVVYHSLPGWCALGANQQGQGEQNPGKGMARKALLLLDTHFLPL